MVDNFYARMYGNAAVPKQSPLSQEKRAVKILGGLKIHNSHLKRIQIGEELVDVPKIEYVNLLEGQIKETRIRLREAEIKISRLQSNYDRLSSEIRQLRQTSKAPVR